MSSTFRTRYDQPVTLGELETLEPELLVNEISRLQNSLKHLRRSNDELRNFLKDDEMTEDEETKREFEDTIKENDETIAKQEERIEMIRLALQEQIGVQATNSHYANFEPPPTTSIPQSSRANLEEGREEEEVTGMGGTSRSREGVLSSNGSTGGVNEEEDGLFL